VANKGRSRVGVVEFLEYVERRHIIKATRLSLHGAASLVCFYIE
jgi:hypothetical protein